MEKLWKMILVIFEFEICALMRLFPSNYLLPYKFIYKTWASGTAVVISTPDPNSKPKKNIWRYLFSLRRNPRFVLFVSHRHKWQSMILMFFPIAVTQFDMFDINKLKVLKMYSKNLVKLTENLKKSQDEREYKHWLARFGT